MVDENKEGLGAAPNPTGLGCCGGTNDGDLVRAVRRYIHAGSPRLALARAKCAPFQPFSTSLRATFPATGTVTVPNVTNDQEFSQDTEILNVHLQVQNESPQANQNEFQAQSDWFYSKQSGIELVLQVLGTPKYQVVPFFAPIRSVDKDKLTKDRCWILGLTQALRATFNARSPLPFAPYTVTLTFNGTCPAGDEFFAGNMSRQDAFRQLGELGYNVSRDCQLSTCR
jgi:hypothetical protein